MPNWYYEKSNLKKTPSYLTGLDFDTETRYRREGARYEKKVLWLTLLEPRSLNLTTTATMVGGTKLFEGAHLTGDSTRFFLDSGRCSNYVFFSYASSSTLYPCQSVSRSFELS